MRARFLPLIWLSLLPLAQLCADTLPLDVLLRYVGKWDGEFTLHSTATGYSEVFPVRQVYWMDGEMLRGLSVMDRESGMVSARSETVIEESRLRTKVYHKEATEEFFGAVQADRVVWLPTDLRRVTDYQLTERFTDEAGERTLSTEGFDSFVYQEGLAHIVYKGVLRYTGKVTEGGLD
ncbi:MAG: hypothetical protein AAGC73_01215 [Verrucomicrobiota bacterium]